MQITVIVLHYITFKDTEKCVDSVINHLNKSKVQIIIVDNGSPNDSYSQIEKKYSMISNVVLLRTSENLGFSRGNNIGIEYAKKHFNSDFIILMNNDTMLIEDDDDMLIQQAYSEYSFAVMGPMIFSRGGYTSNPISFGIADRASINRMIKKNNTIIKCLNMRIKWLYDIKCQFNNIINKLKNDIYNKLHKVQTIESQDNNMAFFSVNDYCVLHGSCLIFSKQFLDNFVGLDERTFLYAEENILQIQLMGKNLKSLYYPNMHIFHADHSSTDAANKNMKKSAIKHYQIHNKSLKALLDVYDEYNIR